MCTLKPHIVSGELLLDITRNWLMGQEKLKRLALLAGRRNHCINPVFCVFVAVHRTTTGTKRFGAKRFLFQWTQMNLSGSTVVQNSELFSVMAQSRKGSGKKGYYTRREN